VEVSDDVPVIVRDKEWNSLLEPPENIFEKLIAGTMEDATMKTAHCSPDDTHDETNEALGNLFTDAKGTCHLSTNTYLEIIFETYKA